ncbi:hypothetical protein sscle_04g034920 [Sclerotinia sclerotiorum 1980 UF-70]|uniref:Uncharacterized protein n=1 Tax=Sclerotinia sclerotiorum (strain ATCC 18683 / 1980 / Ss-1) TaxID=665079 RepID=A0A1D9Q1M0_SCLS1|nr:hypothetical protein sscle_04g034920 [Sclerotinia sclerotiorum 1980 UF-70]
MTDRLSSLDIDLRGEQAMATPPRPTITTTTIATESGGSTPESKNESATPVQRGLDEMPEIVIT